MRMRLYVADHCMNICNLRAGGNLYDSVIKSGGYTERRARNAFQQFMLGLHYCHRMGEAFAIIGPTTNCVSKCTDKSPVQGTATESCRHLTRSDLGSANVVGVASRDIKLENTLIVTSPTGRELIKICDFGYRPLTESSAPLPGLLFLFDRPSTFFQES